MKVNKRFLSFYYEKMDEILDFKLNAEKTILLIIDMQNDFILRDCGNALTLKERGDWERWIPYYDRLGEVTIPANRDLLDFFRKNNLPVSFASKGSVIAESLEPIKNEIVVKRNTDSVIAGTDYLNLLNSMKIETVVVCGVTTDQSVSSTIRGLSDAGYQVICVEDACASPDMELHYVELKIINIKYCHVLSRDETKRIIKGTLEFEHKQVES